MSKTELQKTPWGFRPAHWKMLSWNSFATPSGEPITVAPDSKAKQVTVRVRHKGVVERRVKRNQPRVIRNPNQTRISAGQFIISRIDARNGACGIVPQELDGAIVTKDFRVFDIDSTILLTGYLDYLIGLPVFWKLCSFISDGTTNRVRLDMELFDQMRFPIPPLIEQEIAVNTLQSIGDTLNKTEYMIIKAEQLRETILYKLLTRGLPGRHTEWKEVPWLGTIPANWQVMPFGDVADVSFSNVDKKLREGEIPVKLCNYTDVFYNRSVHSGLSFLSATATSKEYKRWELKKDDVLFTKDSESPYEIGIPSFVNEDMPGVLCGYHLGRARPKSNLIQGKFLSLVIGSDMYRGPFARIANGVTRFGLTLESTRAMKILVPSLVEQNVISKLVDQIDTVIDSLILEYDMVSLLQKSTLEDLISKEANSSKIKGRIMGKVNTYLDSAHDNEESSVDTKVLIFLKGWANQFEWELYASGFKRSADKLIQCSESGELISMIYPIMYMYRHYLELKLKEILVIFSECIGRGKIRIEPSHYLSLLWNKVSRLLSTQCCFVETFNYHYEQLDFIIDHYHKMDRLASNFRYPFKKDGINHSLHNISSSENTCRCHAYIDIVEEKKLIDSAEQYLEDTTAELIRHCNCQDHRLEYIDDNE